MKDYEPHDHVFGSNSRCQICNAHAPETPPFLRRQSTDYECAISMLAAQTVAKSELLGESLKLKARIAELEARCAKYEAFTTAYVNWATSDADGRAEGEYFVEMVEAYDALEKALEVKP